MNKKIIAGGSAAALVALGLGVAAVGTTSAYYSNTNTGGAWQVTTGSIQVSVDDDAETTPDLAYDRLLPGEWHWDSFKVENTGRSAQDVYLQIDNDLVLKAINSLGTYGGIEIKVDGATVFKSLNLNDGYTDANEDRPPVKPLAKNTLLIEGLSPDAGPVTVEIGLKMGEAFETQVPDVVVIEPPIPGLPPIEIPMDKPLPVSYSIVATQPGIAPEAA